MIAPTTTAGEPTASISPVAPRHPMSHAERQRNVAVAVLGLGGALSVSWAGFLGWGAVQLASYILS